MGGCSCGGRWQQGTASLWPGASGSSGHSRGENFGSGDCLGGRQSVRCLESRGREQIRRAGCTGRGPTNGMPVLSAARQRGLQRGTKSEPEVQGAAPAWVCLCETEQAIPKQEGGSGGGVGWHEAPSLSSRRAEQSGASPRQPSPVSREANIGRSAADALRISSRGPKREHKVLRMPSSRLHFHHVQATRRIWRSSARSRQRTRRRMQRKTGCTFWRHPRRRRPT